MLPLGTLGIGNGCIDTEAQASSYPNIAYNNTYGIESYPEEVYDLVVGNLTAPDVGCYDTIRQCRALRAEGDPTGQGTNQTVNEACQAASAVCFGVVLGSYVLTTNVSSLLQVPSILRYGSLISSPKAVSIRSDPPENNVGHLQLF